jgi:hypothetical protein
MRCFEEAWIPGRTVPSLTGLAVVCIGSRHFRAGLLIVTSLRDWRGGAMQLGSAKRRLFCADSRAIRSFLSYDTDSSWDSVVRLAHPALPCRALDCFVRSGTGAGCGVGFRLCRGVHCCTLGAKTEADPAKELSSRLEESWAFGPPRRTKNRFS